jgi:CMP-N,N'-diacetyllegionaminic acid synthase
MNILITICARGGSKGIPGKNIKLLNGKPLINYTIEIAKRFADKVNAKIAISTDVLDIKNVAQNCGIITDYVRPIHLATDQAGKIDTIMDLLNFEEKRSQLKFDYILDLDVTSPLRTIEDLIISFNQINSSDAITLFSVNSASRNPYFNMVEENSNGYFELVKKQKGNVLSRQSAPRVYELNASFYWYKRFFFDLGVNSPICDKSIVYIMPHICFDLDDELDFFFLEFLMLNGKLDFNI